MTGPWRLTLLALGLMSAGALAAPAAAAQALTVCLDEDIALYSVRHKDKGSGFFVALSEAIAQRLERPFKIQWFETKLDPDASRTLDANALLSDGRCELVGGYPLARGALGKPGMPTARMPDFEGAKPADRRRRVQLGTLAPTRAYQYAPLTVVLGPGVAKTVISLADLEGLKLGVEASTMADAILMLYRDGRFVGQITHLVPGRGELLPALEHGDFDATLVNLRRVDAYQAEHPDTKIEASGFYYRIGFNMAYVGLSTEAALIARVDKVIEEMQAKDEIAPLARASGLTYLPPRAPEIVEDFTLSDLQHD
jgi:hypothetical protein